MNPDEQVIDLNKLAQCWGAKDWGDFVATVKSGFTFAVDANTGETVKLAFADIPTANRRVGNA